MMAQLPKLKLARSNLEKFHDSIAILIIFLSFSYLLTKWSVIPSTIAIHFNGNGEADGWGSKLTLFILPILMLLIYIGLTFLRNFPHQFNYMTKITELNANYLYKNAIHLLSWFKLEIVALIAYMQWSMIQETSGHSSYLGIWQFLIALAILIGTVIYYVIQQAKTPPASP